MAVYVKFIVLIADLIEIGFPESYMTDVQNLMVENITRMDAPVKLNDDVYYIQCDEKKQRVKNVIDEINLVIIARDKQIKQETIGEMLFSEKWVEKLVKYTESDYYRLSTDVAIFVKLDASRWIKAITEADAEDIDLFRYWLSRHFHSNVVRGNFKSDLPVIKKIMDGIKAEEENDLIKRANLSWLKRQIGNIIESYKET